jgi:gas vesicle protein
MSEEPESTNSAANFVGWFLSGAILGVAIALVVAPKSGKEARQFLSDKGRETIGDGERMVQTAKDLFDRGRKLVDDAADLFERGRKLVKG